MNDEDIRRLTREAWDEAVCTLGTGAVVRLGRYQILGAVRGRGLDKLYAIEEATLRECWLFRNGAVIWISPTQPL